MKETIRGNMLTVEPAVHGVIIRGIASNQHLRFTSGSRSSRSQLNIRINNKVRNRLKTPSPE